jgi:hypothetical protein
VIVKVPFEAVVTVALIRGVAAPFDVAATA